MLINTTSSRLLFFINLKIHCARQPPLFSCRNAKLATKTRPGTVSHLMSARDNAYLVPVGLRGENKKASRGEKGQTEVAEEAEERMGIRFANLWSKTGTRI